MEKEHVQELMDLLFEMKRLERRKPQRNQMEGKGYILYYLASHGGHAFPGELCQEIQVTTPRITVLLSALEKDEMIERSIDREDRRKVMIRLTRKGQAFVRDHQEGFRSYVARLAEVLGEEDTQALVRILNKICAAKDTGKL